MNDLEKSVAVVGEAWRDSPYYEDAERWTFLFWDEWRPFRPFFERLDLTATLELACGHGRHAEKIIYRAGRLILMDIHEDNLTFCWQRLGHCLNLEIYRNSGFDFQPVEAKSLTAIFCYDAMVHFSPELVASYLKDAARVLRPGGMALFHHSNYDAPPGRPYGQNPHARNHMTKDLFREYVAQADLEMIETKAIEWGGEPDLDRLTLVGRP